jgi:hypothetical protein
MRVITVPQDRYLPSGTMKIAQVAPKRIRQVIAGAWLVSVAIVASCMLAVLFPLGPSFNLQATWYESALVISSPSAQSAKGDRLRSGKVRERREVEPIGTKSAPVSAGERKIPVGCDPAFSRLVKFGNFTARCVT